jgi:mRNA interferase RelE/StbE
MAAYKIFFKASVEKDFRAIPQKDARRILQRIKSLALNARPRGCEKLTGQERYRIRQGAFRIIYSIQDDALTVWIVKIASRKDVYRRK